MAGASTRLARLLALVPYLVGRPGVPVDEVAGVFGVTERQLRADLDLLFMCGLPGYTPGDLIDVSYEGDRITVSNADAVARPLRVTIAEGIALLAAARTLAAEPGLVERDALDRAIVKLEAACAEGAPGLADRVRVTLEPGGPMLPVVEQALDRKRRLRIRYHTASRDDVTERDVDPMRLLNVEGRWYLEAWCRRVEDVRLFRLDRMLEATELDLPAEVPAGAPYRDVEEGLFVPSPDDLLVTLDLDAEARWVADYYPCESVDETPGGGLRIGLRVRDDAWVRRLALRLAGHARVVHPPELAAAVRDQASAALAAYDVG